MLRASNACDLWHFQTLGQPTLRLRCCYGRRPIPHHVACTVRWSTLLAAPSFPLERSIFPHDRLRWRRSCRRTAGIGCSAGNTVRRKEERETEKRDEREKGRQEEEKRRALEDFVERMLRELASCTDCVCAGGASVGEMCASTASISGDFRLVLL